MTQTRNKTARQLAAEAAALTLSPLAKREIVDLDAFGARGRPASAVDARVRQTLVDRGLVQLTARLTPLGRHAVTRAHVVQRARKATAKAKERRK